MTIPFEWLLPLGAVAFYLFDSVSLLYGNELMIELLGRRSRVSSGSRLMIAGRRLYLPNPLTPNALLLQVRWSSNEASDLGEQPAACDMLSREFAQGLRPVRWIMSLLAVLLFVVLPLVSMLYGAGAVLLGVFAVAYLLVIAALGIVWARRKVLAVASRRFVGLALESLACIPFALNLVRKITLHNSQESNLVALLTALDDANVRGCAAELACARIDEYLALEEPGSTRAGALMALRERIRSATVVTG